MRCALLDEVGCWAWVLPLVLGISFSTHAAETSTQDHLRRIDQLYKALEYDVALRETNEAIDELHGQVNANLSLYQGILLYVLHKDREEGKKAFRAAFEKEPDAPSPVQPLPDWIEKDMEAIRAQVKKDLQPRQAQQPQQPQHHPSQSASVRSYAWIPAVAGGACVVAGGLSIAKSRSELSMLRNDDPRITRKEDVQAIGSRGQKWQTLGGTLLGIGAASLTGALGMYLLGAPHAAEAPSHIEVGTTGTALFLQGVWP